MVLFSEIACAVAVFFLRGWDRSGVYIMAVCRL